jgi:hypothetical protein
MLLALMGTVLKDIIINTNIGQNYILRPRKIKQHLLPFQGDFVLSIISYDISGLHFFLDNRPRI